MASACSALSIAHSFPSDNRFIAKELSRAELETMATFGPAYFDYMSSSMTADVSETRLRFQSLSHPVSSAQRSWQKCLDASKWSF